MANGGQKNFTLPKELAKKWVNFQGKGSKESSKNASGALFLYMLMPTHVRESARTLAYMKNLKQATRQFWDEVQQYQEELDKVKSLFAVAQALETLPDRMKVEKSSKSG